MNFDDWTDHDEVEDVAGSIEVPALSITTAKEQRAEKDHSTFHSHLDIVVENSMMRIVNWCEKETRLPRSSREGL